MLELMIPNLMSHRAQVEALASDVLFGDLTGEAVLVNFRDADTLAPCVVDELVKQILQVRNAKRLISVKASPRIEARLMRSVDRRASDDRLSFFYPDAESFLSSLAGRE